MDKLIDAYNRAAADPLAHLVPSLAAAKACIDAGKVPAAWAALAAAHARLAALHAAAESLREKGA